MRLSSKTSGVSLHFAKHKACDASVNGLQRHNERTEGSGKHSNKRIDDARTADNVMLKLADGTYQQQVATIIETHRDGGLNGVRRDAVRMCEATVQLSGQVLDRSEVEQERVLRQSYDWLKETFGAHNIVSAVIHKDETNMHLHVDFVPIKDGKLTAKAILSKGRLQQYQTDFLEHLQQSEPTLNFVRGSSEYNGLPQDVFEQLQEERKEMMEEVEERERELDATQTALDALRDDLERQGKDLSIREQNVLKRELKVSEGEMALKAVQDALKASQDDLERQVEDLSMWEQKVAERELKVSEGEIALKASQNELKNDRQKQNENIRKRENRLMQRQRDLIRKHKEYLSKLDKKEQKLDGAKESNQELIQNIRSAMKTMNTMKNQLKTMTVQQLQELQEGLELKTSAANATEFAEWVQSMSPENYVKGLSL